MEGSKALGEAMGARLSGPALLEAFRLLKEKKPQLRARDAANGLGVSEAELVAARAGAGVVRLEANWADVVRALPALGEVMALTRNEHCVHEKHGAYDKIDIGPGHGLVLNHDIDLRLFMTHWRFGFAVTEEVASGRRKSLQFFDRDGTAVHKVYVTDKTDETAYDALVARFQSDDQATALKVTPPSPRKPDDADIHAPRGDLLHRWEMLKDTHEFFGMLREAGVGRLQAMRLAEGRFTRRLVPNAARRLLEAAALEGAPIMCFVGNPGCIQIHTGPVSAIKPLGPWINVLDPGFNLHLREDAVASAWAVVKPTADGEVTSVELYDEDGFCFTQFFGERKPGKVEREDWRAIVRSLPDFESELATA